MYNFLSTAVAVSAAVRVTAAGDLTSIEKDGSVVIDNKVYVVSSSVVVLGYAGERISLRDLTLPQYVSFEYEYTSRGGVIVKIQLVGG